MQISCIIEGEGISKAGAQGESEGSGRYFGTELCSKQFLAHLRGATIIEVTTMKRHFVNSIANLPLFPLINQILNVLLKTFLVQRKQRTSCH